MPPGKKPPPPSEPAPAKRKRWLWPALRILVGIVLYVLAALLVFLVIEHALSAAVAVVAVMLTGVLAPLALTQLLTPAFRKVDASATFLSVLPGVAGLCALLTLVVLPLTARGPVSQALTGVASRHPHAGALPIGAARLVGRALDTATVDAGVHDAGTRDASTHDATHDTALAIVDAPAPAYDATVEATADVVDVPDVVDAPDAPDLAPPTSLDDNANTLAVVTPCRSPRTVLLADLEGDGRDEIVLQCDTSLHILALTEGTLTERLRVVPVAPAGLVAAMGRPAVFDMDGDGRRDVIVCEYDTTERGGGRGGSARYVANRGDGRFGSLVDLDRLDGCAAVALGDVTGDGREEMLIAHKGNPYQPTLPQGDLTWFAHVGRTWTRRARLPVGRWPESITLVDVNGDHINDAVVEHGWDDAVTVVLPGARAGLRPMDATLRAPTVPNGRVATGRFDNDEAPDTAEITPDNALRLTGSHPPDAPAIRELSGTPVIVPPPAPPADASTDAEPDDADEM